MTTEAFNALCDSLTIDDWRQTEHTIDRFRPDNGPTDSTTDISVWTHGAIPILETHLHFPKIPLSILQIIRIQRFIQIAQANCLLRHLKPK